MGSSDDERESVGTFHSTSFSRKLAQSREQNRTIKPKTIKMIVLIPMTNKTPSIDGAIISSASVFVVLRIIDRRHFTFGESVTLDSKTNLGEVNGTAMVSFLPSDKKGIRNNCSFSFVRSEIRSCYVNFGILQTGSFSFYFSSCRANSNGMQK